MDNILNDINADPIIGAHLFKTLNVSPYAVSADPSLFAKVRQIADFFSGHPDPLFVIDSVSRSNKNPNIKQVDHLASYVKLSKDKFAYLSKLDQLDKELKYYR